MGLVGRFLWVLVLLILSAKTVFAVSCGDTITNDTILTENLNCTGDGLIVGADNITLDCQRHNISGNYTYYGINVENHDNIMINDCIVTNFKWGIYLSSSNNNTLTSNIANNNDYGIYFIGSRNNTVTNNTADYNNRDGFYLHDTGSTGNTLTNNHFCFNNRPCYKCYDIYDIDATLGNNNTCDITYNYNDTGITTGCTYPCIWTQSINLISGWNLISIPLVV